MPARTGEEYIKGLQEHPREVWIDGERVEDVTTHPALRNGVRSVAALYEMQHDPALREAILAGRDPFTIVDEWRPARAAWLAHRSPVLLYP